jgi:segregation and condensation protein B
LADLPDIAPLLPDVDVIDDISETLDSEPRFMKLNPAAAPQVPPAIVMDED